MQSADSTTLHQNTGKLKNKFISQFQEQLSEKKNKRIFRFVYSPAFREWLDEIHIDLAGHYKIFTLKDIECSVSPAREPQSLCKAIVLKLAIFVAGYMPKFGTWIGVASTVFDVAQEVYGYHIRDSELRKLGNMVRLRYYPSKRYHTLKYIVFIPDISDVTDEELHHIYFLYALIKRRFISSTALIICRPDDSLPLDLSDEECDQENVFLLDDKTILDLFGPDIQSKNFTDVLNTIGIRYYPTIKSILSSDKPKADIVASLIDKLLEKTIKEGSVQKKEFHSFLKLCSLLFEPFVQGDIEQIYPHSKIPPDQLVEYALTSNLIKKDSESTNYYFIEYFIRDFYREHTQYTFSTQVYQDLYKYLESKYPYQYTDIAVLSQYIHISDEERQSKCIIAYYHESNVISQRKKQSLLTVMNRKGYIACQTYLKLDELYRKLDQNKATDVSSIWKAALDLVKGGTLSSEAKCCMLGLIATVVFETETGDRLYQQILPQYSSLFVELNFFSQPNHQYIEYAVDAILCSVSLEVNYFTQNQLDRLLGRIDFHIEELPTIKRLRLLRLGNIILKGDRDRAHQYTRRAYEQSEDFPVEHMLSAINYSASLLCMGSYKEALKVLEDTMLLEFNINSNTDFSHKNNLLISQILSDSINKSTGRKSFKNLYTQVNRCGYSDAIIIKNNYAAALINSAAKTYQTEVEGLLREIMNTNDKFHQFFASHNYLILCCLIRDKTTFENIHANVQIPKLFSTYSDFFNEKFQVLDRCFEECTSINQIESILKPLSDQFQDCCTPFYNSPVLWGVMERWFE